MLTQVDYYNQFGERHRAEILACPEPHLWTTDYAEKGRVYREMKARIDMQSALVRKRFTPDGPVLDVGCGFGRQAYLLARCGFSVTGTDTSPTFVDIARALFRKHGLRGEFHCLDIAHDASLAPFPQVLLLDVLEHVPVNRRKAFVARLAALTASGGTVLLSVPHVKRRFTSQVNNRLRKRVTQHFAFFRRLEEHPFPVPQEAEMAALADRFYVTEEKLHQGETDYYALRKK